MRQENKQKIETVKLAGYGQWGIQVNGMLDCDIPLSNEESSAEKAAKKRYNGARIITTRDVDHYSNVV